jgi:hypothetical protein
MRDAQKESVVLVRCVRPLMPESYAKNEKTYLKMESARISL